MVGIPGSGKSFYTKKLVKELGINTVVLSVDEVKFSQNISSDKAFKLVREDMKSNLLAGKNVIVDATNVTMDKRTYFLDYVKDIDCEKEAVYLKANAKTAIKQNNLRKGIYKVPDVAIYSAAKRMEEPTMDEGFSNIKVIEVVNNGTIVFDFDGVIHSYISSWKGPEVIPDPPVNGIKEAIDDIRKAGYKVIVVSSRCEVQEGMDAINNYLEKYGIEVDGIQATKPAAIAYIDDRAICFDGDAGSLLGKIKSFKPWNKK